VEAGGYLIPPKHPQADEGRLEEKGKQRLDGQRHGEDIADVAGILRPVHAQLELEGKTRRHPQGEVDEKELAPKLRHPQIHLVPGGHVAALHVGHEDGKAQGEGYEEKMKHRRHGELDPAQGQGVHKNLRIGQGMTLGTFFYFFTMSSRFTA